MLASVAGSWYPDPAAVVDAGAPMYTFTFGFGLMVRAQISLNRERSLLNAEER